MVLFSLILEESSLLIHTLLVLKHAKKFMVNHTANTDPTKIMVTNIGVS